MRLVDAAATAAITLCIVAVPSLTLAQATEPAPQPSATPTAAADQEASPAPATPQSEGGFDMSKLTPEQREALRLAVIKLSQNPIGNITVLPFQNNFNYGVGPYSRFQYNLNVQPVIPIMLSEKWSLVARTIFPVIVQPSFNPPTLCATAAGCGSTFGIGDTQEQLYFGPKTKPGALIWGAGPIFQFPTGSPQAVLGTGAWGAGFNAVALVTPGKWVMGTLVTQVWSFAGRQNFTGYSSFLVQPFVNYNLKDGWALSTAPSFTSNWLSTTDKWAAPIGGGVAKTFKAGDQLMQLSASYYTFLARQPGSPQTQLRVQWSLLWPVKRGINIQQLLEQAK
jgi:hypothetical protein